MQGRDFNIVPSIEKKKKKRKSGGIDDLLGPEHLYLHFFIRFLLKVFVREGKEKGGRKKGKGTKVTLPVNLNSLHPANDIKGREKKGAGREKQHN